MKTNTENGFLKNIFWACVFLIVMIGGAQIALRIYTQHGKYITVPDFTDETLREASAEASYLGLVVVPIDSVFIPRMGKGAVFTQNPHAGSKVKKGRKIRVIINATVSKKVLMPDLVGLSMRQAKSELDSRGLKLGRLQYVSDIATNNVLHQHFEGVEIKPGEEIFSGSVIELILGLNDYDNITIVPNVKGLRYHKAVDVLKESSLNVGRARFDKSVRTYADTLNSVVFYQNPELGEEPVSARMGSDVSISLTVDENKISNLR